MLPIPDLEFARQRPDRQRRLRRLVQERRRCEDLVSLESSRGLRLSTVTLFFFWQAIRSGDRSRLIITPEQAALTIEVVKAAIQSSKEGRSISL